MTYTVRWSPMAEKRLRGLERPIILRIIEKLEHAKEMPYHFFERLAGEKLWRMRVGDYRVIAEIEESAKSIMAHTLGHRKNIYQKLG